MNPSDSILPFTGARKAALEEFYGQHDLLNAADCRKLVALKIEMGESRFHSYGGGETEAMELRALERIYLLERGL